MRSPTKSEKGALLAQGRCISLLNDPGSVEPKNQALQKNRRSQIQVSGISK